MKLGPISICRSRSLDELQRHAERQDKRVAELDRRLFNQALSGERERRQRDAIGADQGIAPVRPTKAPRSALFLHNNYYHHLYLARALRQRGWDAVCASMEPDDSPNSIFSHGQDISLYDPVPEIFAKNVSNFFFEARERFGLVYLHGTSRLSFFPEWWDKDPDFKELPWDLLDLKRRGVILGFSVSGCLDGISQSAFTCWSGGACTKCVWQTRPEVCSDRRNLALGHKLVSMFDILEVVTDPPLDWFGASNVVHEPLTFALDPDVWSPELEIPSDKRLARDSDEILIFHGVGNFHQRTDQAGQNLKGTKAVHAAIEQLRNEGCNIRLIFADGISNDDVRYLLAQVDIIVDQLNYGRFGALAREGMMTGKPTISRLVELGPEGTAVPSWIPKCPIVTADETSLTDELRMLVNDQEMREKIGHRSREYAIEWYAADACAARLEGVSDAIFEEKRQVFG